MNRRIFFLFSFLFSLSNSAQAFVPPASYVLSKWTEQTKGKQSLRIRQKVTLYDRVSGAAASTYEEEIRVKRGGKYRRTSTYSNGKVETVVGPQRAARILGGKSTVISPSEAYGPVGLFFSLSDSKSFAVLARQAGVDLDVTRFVLKDGSAGIQVGNLPALVVAKENFIPLAADWGTRTYRFTPAPVSKFPVPYPSIIETFEQGKLVERVDVSAVDSNLSFSDESFDIRALVTESKKK